MRKALVMTGTLLLAGCSAQPFIDDRMAEVSNRPEPYRVGFGDGCYSGRFRSNVVEVERKRDDKRMTTDAHYALGWNDGFNRCDVGAGNLTFFKTDKPK